MKDKPTIIVKIKGDAGKYTVWGIDWLNHKMLIERSCGYEQVPFEKITIIESELAQLKAEAEKEVSDEIECTWINEKVRCAFYKKKCHLCTKNGATTETGNHFAPYYKPTETI